MHLRINIYQLQIILDLGKVFIRSSDILLKPIQDQDINLVLSHNVCNVSLSLRTATKTLAPSSVIPLFPINQIYMISPT